MDAVSAPVCSFHFGTKASAELKLAQGLLSNDKKEAARSHLKKILKDFPDSDEADEAAKLLKKGGTTKEEDEFIETQRRLATSVRDSREAAQLLEQGNAAARTGELEEALTVFGEAIRLDPQLALAYNARAWILATALDEKLRDGTNAVESAKKACELTKWKDHSFIDTLAAAYAESGEFEEAVKWQRKAVSAAPGNQKADVESRLNLYRSGKPYREQLKK